MCLFIIIVKVVLSLDLFVTFVLLVSYTIVVGVFFLICFGCLLWVAEHSMEVYDGLC